MRPDASKKLAAAAPKKRANPAVIGAIVAAVVILGVVVTIVFATKDKPGSGSAQPVGVTGGKAGGIFANAATAKSGAPTLDLYEDFQCPACAQLEERIGAQKASMAKAGDIKLVVHTLSFLDGNLRNDSSARSANAAACAADAGKFLEYRALVFAAQPAQEGDGYTDAQLTQFAEASGITGPALTTWQQCTSSGQHAGYVTDVQEQSGRDRINSTPTIKLNGEDVTKNVQTAEALVAAVKTATK